MKARRVSPTWLAMRSARRRREIDGHGAAGTTDAPHDFMIAARPRRSAAVWRWRASLGLMAASGFAGLGYQLAWTQQSAVWLGHEAAAVLAVVAAFFGGLAVGALALGSRIERSPRPRRWYVACELAIAVWSLVLIVSMPAFGGMLLQLTGTEPTPSWQWAVAFIGTFCLLLPATAAMGATLPAIERATAPMRGAGRSIAAHYAANTFGAVLGVFATTFWLVPAFGLARTAALCCTLNVLCAATALAALPRRAGATQATSATATARVSHAVSPSRASHAVLARLVGTGLLGIGYEVLVVRVLSQVAEDTVYTFAMLLVVYLIGTALGAAFYHRRIADRGADADADADNPLTDRLLCALAAACLLGTASLWLSEHVRNLLLHSLPSGMTAAVGIEGLLALIAFGLPTVVMGALFSHLGDSASAHGIAFGRAIGANTLGAAAAPLLFGVLMAPLLGPKPSLLLIPAGYLALTTRRAWRRPVVWIVAVAAAALSVATPPLAFVEIPDGGHLVSYQDGVLGAVSVVEDVDGVRRLRIDNRQQEGTSSSRRVDARQALLPLLLHPAPRRALFLGLGTGVTASAAADDPGVQVDAVELLPEVIVASSFFSRGTGDEAEASARRLHATAADARRFVRADRQHYDVIVSDNFHPARSGSGALYTVEHFRAVRERLTADGVFCQWLPLHQLDLGTLRSIVRSFTAVYPRATALLASNSLQTPVLGLVARADERPLDIGALRQRVARAAAIGTTRDVGIEDEFAVLGAFVAGPAALMRFGEGASLNTDDRPVVAYAAPRATYAPETLPSTRLLMLMREISIAPADILDVAADAAFAHRLTAYWSARDRFLSSGRGVRPAASAAAMLAQVREPLLSVLHTSPDFRPAYDPLLRMAHALARSDAPSARALLLELVRLQPSRPEAAAMLRALERTPSAVASGE